MRSDDIRRATPSCKPRLKSTLFAVPAVLPAADQTIEQVREELRQALERLRRAERKLSAIEALDGVDKPRIRAAISHVQMISRPSGYVLADADEPPPTRGDDVEVEHQAFVVERLAPSPFPDDLRRCAILRRV
jgi:acyl-CoA reductase-like NAD-dependent aldehyde dehydrogenase